jgi:hypothetical protein
MFRWIKRLFGYSDVLVLGSAHLDTVVDTKELIHDKRDENDRLVARSVRYGVGDIRKSIGGSAYNIAVNIARPPHGRWTKNTAAIFTFLPSSVELTEVIVRKLRVAGVAVGHVQRIRSIALAGGDQQIPHLGSFVGMRHIEADGRTAGIAIARSSSLLRYSELFDGNAVKKLTAAAAKSRIFVIDTDTHEDVASEAINIAQETETPLFVAVMSIDALETYFSSLTSDTRTPDTTAEAVCVGVRAVAISSWLESEKKSKKPHLDSESIDELTRFCDSPLGSDVEVSAMTAKALCNALNAHNAIISNGLKFLVLAATGAALSVTVEAQGSRNWMGASDAAFASVVDTFARRLKKRKIDIDKLEASLIGSPDKDRELSGSITLFVRNVLGTTGATRNAGIDSTDVEHPIREWWFKMRAQILRYVGIYSLGLITAFGKTVLAFLAVEWRFINAWINGLFGRLF